MQEIKKLLPGEYVDLNFQLFTNMRVKDEIVLTLVMREANTNGSYPVKLSIDKPLQTIQEFVVKGEEIKKENTTVIPELTADIWKDIPLTNKKNNDAVAVIIGNRNYKKTAPVEYSINDAQIIKQYLIKVLGYREANIIYEENASYGSFLAFFGNNNDYKGKLYNYIKKGVSDVFIYYSGHGAPDLESGKAYFVPVETDPEYVKLTGYSMELFYKNITQLPAKSITVVLDACFSGGSGGGDIIKKVSPVMITVEHPIRTISNGVVITSTDKNQVSCWYPEKRHSMFTYYFVKGLKGEADANGDKVITLEEMRNYVEPQVSYMARRNNNREQNPQFIGDGSTVLVNYNK